MLFKLGPAGRPLALFFQGNPGQLAAQNFLGDCPTTETSWEKGRKFLTT